MPSDDKRIDRRRFFREGLRELLRPLASAIDPIQRVAAQLGAVESAAPSPPHAFCPEPLEVWLRPPGALPEEAFREICSRCGICVQTCPVQAIRLEPGGNGGGGVPYIDPEQGACVVCDGLKCTYACPSGALIPGPVDQIAMGTARWDEGKCIRRRGDECMVCVSKCPQGSAAIEQQGRAIRVITQGCIGCGVCQNVCPTTPRSITITPAGTL